MTELSTDEVIMNYPVKSHAETDDPEMKIVLVEPSDETTNDHKNKNAAIVLSYVHPIVTLQRPTTQQQSVSSPTITIQLQVVTTNPNTDKDYQFAMDVIVPPAEEGAAAPTFPASAVQFRNGGCEHRHRITGRRNDILTLELVPEQIIMTTNNDINNLRVVAGWAAGHEAVRLTMPLEFRFVASSYKEETETDLHHHQQEVKDSEHTHDNKALAKEEEEEEDRNVAKHHNDGILLDPQKVLDEQMKFQMHGIQQQLLEKRKKGILLKNGIHRNNNDNKEEQKAKRFEQYQKMEQLVIHKDQSNDDEEEEEGNQNNSMNKDGESRHSYHHHRAKKRSDNLLRDFRIGFDSTADEFATFTFASYAQGALFLMVTPIVLVYGLLCIRRNALYTKGRLAL
jgi:hypothetical protein